MCGGCVEGLNKMSTSSQVHAVRINNTVRISLTGLHSDTQMSTRVRMSGEASAVSSSYESRPTSHYRRSLSITGPQSTMASGRLYVSTEGLSSTFSVGHAGHSWTTDRGLPADVPVNTDRQRPSAPDMPLPPEYTKTEQPPPPYDPGSLVPVIYQRRLDEGRRWTVSTLCPPPPPPSRWPSTAARVGPLNSTPLVGELCMGDDYNDYDDDDVFVTEKTSTQPINMRCHS